VRIAERAAELMPDRLDERDRRAWPEWILTMAIVSTALTGYPTEEAARAMRSSATSSASSRESSLRERSPSFR
jgi:hypothetical protein